MAEAVHTEAAVIDVRQWACDGVFVYNFKCRCAYFLSSSRYGVLLLLTT